MGLLPWCRHWYKRQKPKDMRETIKTFYQEKPSLLEHALIKLGVSVYSIWGGSISHNNPNIQVVDGWGD